MSLQPFVNAGLDPEFRIGWFLRWYKFFYYKKMIFSTDHSKMTAIRLEKTPVSGVMTSFLVLGLDTVMEILKNP